MSTQVSSPDCLEAKQGIAHGIVKLPAGDVVFFRDEGLAENPIALAEGHFRLKLGHVRFPSVRPMLPDPLEHRLAPGQVGLGPRDRIGGIGAEHKDLREYTPNSPLRFRRGRFETQ
ncbi:MAG: hypothetical protein RBS80_27625 [Thermoguttaceae bacterium]|nr:hypothetical protein [Thermoguttaceae bacterium]